MLYMDPCKEWELETGLVWLIQAHHGTGILKYYIEKMEEISVLAAMILKKFIKISNVL